MKTYILCFSDNEWAEVVATNEDEAKVQAFLFTRKDVGPVLLYCFERGERCPEECKATTQERGEEDQLILQFRRFKMEGRWFVQVYKSNIKHWVGHYLIPETLVFHPWWRAIEDKSPEFYSFRTKDEAREGLHQYKRAHPCNTVRFGTREIRG